MLRIYQSEEKQFGAAFFDAHDYKEVFHLGQAWSMANRLGTGTAKSYTQFYATPRNTM